MEQVSRSALPDTLALLCIHLTQSWDHDDQVLVYSLILRLSLPGFVAVVNNLYSALAVTKSSSDMPLRLSFYHALFGKFLQDIKRSTPKYCIANASNVYRRCFAAFAKPLNHISHCNSFSELDSDLSWTPPNRAHNMANLTGKTFS
ncbi:hypothetical protein AN958_03794 [Leucoagaricus sp. SymC.cos]|nr:hypothetical protein AN958_03794 [Leucoagaricus sp. SymC.cos]